MSNNPALVLTERHEAVQRLLGDHHRRMLAAILAEQCAGLGSEETIGIFLSGGIDSCSLLLTMIHDLNLRVSDAYTAVLTGPDGEPVESTDYLRAKRICGHYGIQHHAVVVPREPEEIVGRMWNLSQREMGDGFLHNRADFEVLVLYMQALEAASDQGNKIVLSGLNDGDIHQYSRKHSVPNKRVETHYSSYQINANWLGAVSDKYNAQRFVMNEEAQRLGLSFLLPHLLLASQLPYWDVPWKLLNQPREKWISQRAYSEELLAASGRDKAHTAPMQCDDSGAREFFDSMVRESKLADEICGRPVHSSTMLTNLLKEESAKRTHQIPIDDDFPFDPDDEMPYWAREDLSRTEGDHQLSTHLASIYGNFRSGPMKWLGHLTSGGEAPNLPQKISDGQADLSYVPKDFGAQKRAKGFLSDLVDTSSPASRERFYADGSTGELAKSRDQIDLRVDCFGGPLHRGAGFTQTMCPRAQAGLCGTPQREVAKIHQCSTFDSWESVAVAVAWHAPAPNETVRENHRVWAASAQEVSYLIKSGLSEFIRARENLFPKEADL